MVDAIVPPHLDFEAALLVIMLCAFIDILSPGVLGVTGYLLLIHKDNLASRLAIFLLTTQLCFLMLGIVFHLGVDSIFHFIEGLESNQMASWFYTIVGVSLVLISFYKPKKGMESRFWSRLPKQVSLRAMVVLGIIVFLIEFSTALPYFYSILLMDRLSFGPVLSISILLGYNALMVLPSILLLAIHFFFRKWVHHTLDKIRAKLLAAPLSTVLTAIGVIGVVLFNIGIRGISS